MNQPGLARVPRSVRAVFFDAVGTVIHPEPSAGAAYAEFGRRFGTRLEMGEVGNTTEAAAERLREKLGLRRLLVTILTSSDQPKDINRAYDLGRTRICSNLTVKPN